MSLPPIDANGFPIDPIVDDLPAGMTEKERHEFAFRVIAEQGERLGDYLFAAVRQATSVRTNPRDHALMERWFAMVDLIQQIYGDPIALTYSACDRIAAEKDAD